MQQAIRTHRGSVSSVHKLLLGQAAATVMSAVSRRRTQGGAWVNAAPSIAAVDTARVGACPRERVRSSSGPNGCVGRSYPHGGSVESIQASTMAHEIRVAQAQAAARVLSAEAHEHASHRAAQRAIGTIDYRLVRPPSPPGSKDAKEMVPSQGCRGSTRLSRPKTKSSPARRGSGRLSALAPPVVYSIYTL